MGRRHDLWLKMNSVSYMRQNAVGYTLKRTSRSTNTELELHECASTCERKMSNTLTPRVARDKEETAQEMSQIKLEITKKVKTKRDLKTKIQKRSDGR